MATQGEGKKRKRVVGKWQVLYSSTSFNAVGQPIYNRPRTHRKKVKSASCYRRFSLNFIVWITLKKRTYPFVPAVNKKMTINNSFTLNVRWIGSTVHTGDDRCKCFSLTKRWNALFKISVYTIASSIRSNHLWKMFCFLFF